MEYDSNKVHLLLKHAVLPQLQSNTRRLATAAGSSVETIVFLCEAIESSAEMEPITTDGNQDLALFWEEIPPVQRLKCQVLQDVKTASSEHQRIHATLLQVMASNGRLEQKLERCLWTLKVFMVLAMVLTALWGFTLYIHYSDGYLNRWTTAKN
ncbi:motile sperm domain-containing protein 2-like [Sander vitreus]